MEIGLVSIGGIAAVLGYKFVRPYFSAKVNCWFCNHDFKIDYEDRKGWTCPGCDQYNGSDEDEPEKTSIQKQKIRYCLNQKKSERGDDKGNGLCQTCNLNQELKVHQLKNFIPENPQKYDEEIQEYARHLERTYRLCRYCEASLHQTLGQQDSWLKPKLLSWKLEKNRQSPLTSALNSSKVNDSEAVDGESWIICRIWIKHLILAVLTVFAFLSCLAALEIRHDIFNFANSSLPAIGAISSDHSQHFDLLSEIRKDVIVIMALTCHLACIIREDTTCWRGTRRGKVQKIGISSWLGLSMICIVDEWTPWKVDEQVILFSTVICFSVTLYIMIFQFPTRDQVRRVLRRKSRLTREQKARDDHEKLGNFGEWQWTNEEDVLSQDLVSTSTPTTSFFATPEPNNSSRASNDSEQECDISSLKIKAGQDNKVSNNHWECMSNSAFSLRQYDPAGNDSAYLFGQQVKRPIVRPPKFIAKASSVAQSSWVAGGYWRPRNLLLFGTPNFPNLPSSRCSSQTSGFVSNNGKVSPVLPSKTVVQKYWEQDCASVFSEPQRKIVSGNGEFSMGPLVDQLSFFDVSKTGPVPGPHRESSPLYETDEEENKNETLIASGGFNPPISSSPENKVDKATSPKSFWDMKIQIDVSVYSLLFFLSVGANIALSAYLGSRFVNF